MVHNWAILRMGTSFPKGPLPSFWLSKLRTKGHLANYLWLWRGAAQRKRHPRHWGLGFIQGLKLGFWTWPRNRINSTTLEGDGNPNSHIMGSIIFVESVWTSAEGTSYQKNSNGWTGENVYYGSVIHLNLRQLPMFPYSGWEVTTPDTQYIPCNIHLSQISQDARSDNDAQFFWHWFPSSFVFVMNQLCEREEWKLNIHTEYRKSLGWEPLGRIVLKSSTCN